MDKPTLKQQANACLKFLWNGETKEFLGRGSRSWCEIGIFYLIFYACLAGFFAATIAVFYQTIDADYPRLQGKDSLLKSNPGMGYQPMPDMETTLIYARKPTKDNKAYANSINEVLRAYREDMVDNVDCSGINETRPNEKTACKFNFTSLTEKCNEENAYGMIEGKPCVLLKLNKIFGWIPDVWTKESIKDASVPDSIKAIYTSDRIWVECHGENNADEENLGHGMIEYFPMQGFPLAYYPYEKQQSYKSPLVFVKFNNVTHHLGLMIECKALAKNIAVDRVEKEGSVHFELLVDP